MAKPTATEPKTETDPASNGEVEEIPTETEAAAPRVRRGAWTSEDIRKMCGHLTHTHEVPADELFGQAMSALKTKHDGFHSDQDHWKEGK